MKSLANSTLFNDYRYPQDPEFDADDEPRSTPTTYAMGIWVRLAKLATEKFPNNKIINSGRATITYHGGVRIEWGDDGKGVAVMINPDGTLGNGYIYYERGTEHEVMELSDEELIETLADIFEEE